MGWHWTPIHQRITPTAANRELKALQSTIEELPLIKLSDPALVECMENGETIEVGDVIRITRNSKVAGEGYKYYRRVIL